MLTGADLVADDVGTLPTLPIFKRPDGSPMTMPPRRLLAHEVVRFVGEAGRRRRRESRAAAQAAAEAVVVDYEELPAVTDPPRQSSPARRRSGPMRPTISSPR